jgi:Tat protein translocase TatB subunit
MFGLGMGELIVILIVALIVLGPAKLPKLAQDLGKAIREFRKAADDVKQELQADENIRRPLQELTEAMTLPPEELKRREAERKRLAEERAAGGDASGAPAPAAADTGAPAAAGPSAPPPAASPLASGAPPAAPIASTADAPRSVATSPPTRKPDA